MTAWAGPQLALEGSDEPHCDAHHPYGGRCGLSVGYPGPHWRMSDSLLSLLLGSLVIREAP